MRKTAIGLMAFASYVVLAQSGPQPAFDVASVKTSPPERPNFPFHLGPGSFSMQGRLVDLIIQAYEVKYYQVTGGPDWALSTFYQVQARAVDGAPAVQVRLMLQTLLADRFQLRVRRKTRIQPGYVLALDKNGPKIGKPRVDVPEDSKGSVQIGGGIWARASTLDNVATGLAYRLEQPVVDETGIYGHYDFRVQFDDGADAAAVASVIAALHEVGLKLESRKVPVEMVVIESAQRPAAN
jgi:uncharacterized protein (TIGR03435 family)